MNNATQASFIVYAVGDNGAFTWVAATATHEEAVKAAKEFHDYDVIVRKDAPYAGCYISPATFIPANPEEFAEWYEGG